MSNVHLSGNDGHPQPIQEKLARLTEGTEVNVHVGGKIYYEASFTSLDYEEETAVFIIDRFYEHGGKQKSFSFNEITGLDLPLSENHTEGEDE
jgi:hypothetical protein